MISLVDTDSSKTFLHEFIEGKLGFYFNAIIIQAANKKIV